MRSNPTREESLLWERLRRNGLGVHFRRQQIIDGFIADFYCHAAGLVVEVDGDIHDSPEQRSYDLERDAILKDRGLSMLRLDADLIRSDMKSALARIRAAIDEGGSSSVEAPLPFREGAGG
jgi:very-short-patch-repair endonuclease